MPPLPADSIHARACKLKCEKILTRPTAMYLCALRGGTADCRLKQPAVSASLCSVQGAAPLARLALLPAPAPKR